MVLGNIIGGKLSDRFRSASVVGFAYSIAAMALIVLFLLPSASFLAIAMMCICTSCLFMVGAPNQLLVLQNSRGGEMMGAAMIQIAFNLGNALGSYSGGLPIDNNIGVNFASIIGMGYLIVAIFIVSILVRRQKLKEQLMVTPLITKL